jgi:hypothetical protein
MAKEWKLKTIKRMGINVKGKKLSKCVLYDECGHSLNISMCILIHDLQIVS